MAKQDKYLKQLKKFEPVKSKKDYWRKHEILKKAIGGMYKNLKRFLSNPKEGLNTFEDILDEAIRIKLITKEYKKEKMKELLNKITKPSQYKQKVRAKIRKAKDRFFGKKNKDKKELSEKEMKEKENKMIKSVEKDINKRISKEDEKDNKQNKETTTKDKK